MMPATGEGQLMLMGDLFFSFYTSLPRWKRLHLNSAYPWGRSPYVRTSFGTLEPRSERREGAS